MSMLLLTMGPQLSISMSAPNLSIGSPGTIVLRAVGAAGGVTWALISSDLPSPEWDSALTTSGATATLNAATIFTPGTYSFRVRAVDSFRQPVEAEFSVRIQAMPITISGSLPPEWSVGVPTSTDLLVSGGSGVYVSAGISSGEFPPGISVSLIGSALRISGSPEDVGNGIVTLWVMDSDGGEGSINLEWSSGAALDPYWSYVVSLTHLDTGYSDAKGKTWVASLGTSIDNVVYKFGGGSLRWTAGDGLQSEDSLDWAFGAGDFTVELWALLDGMPVGLYYTPFGNWVSNDGWCFFVRPGGLVDFRINGQFIVSSTGYVAVNTWHHYRFCRKDGVGYLFVDGVLAATGPLTGNLTSTRGPRLLRNYATSDVWPGVVDEQRTTKGVARSTSSFSPPDAPFPEG